MNWNNLFCAGGSVAACLMNFPWKSFDKNTDSIEVYFRDTMYRSSDIDLYIYGLDKFQTEEKVFFFIYFILFSIILFFYLISLFYL